jgi:hypothetical protein
MKNSLFYIFITFTLISCSKNQTIPVFPDSKDDLIVKMNFRPLSNGFETVTSNFRSFHDDDALYEILFDQFYLMDSLLRDSEFFNYLLNESFCCDTDQVKLTSILRSYNEFAHCNIFNDSLLYQIDNNSNFIHSNCQYYPLIYISNFATLDTANKPIFAFGLDLENIDDTLSDIIYGRYYDQNDSLNEIEVDETNGLGSEIPIIILTISLDQSSLMNENQIIDVQIRNVYSNEFLKSWNDYPNFYEYRIDYLYDRSNKAEYSEEHTLYYWTNHNHHCGSKEIIRRIHKKDIGDPFKDDWVLYSEEDDTQGIWLVTFEWDFFTNAKPVFVPGPYTVEILCKMTYHDEYYQVSYFPINSITGDSVIIRTKGFLKIRTEY